jgi:hypothetical protein
MDDHVVVGNAAVFAQDDPVRQGVVGLPATGGGDAGGQRDIRLFTHRQPDSSRCSTHAFTPGGPVRAEPNHTDYILECGQYILKKLIATYTRLLVLAGH